MGEPTSKTEVKLADAGWLRSPTLHRVIEAAGGDEGEARIVGGAVRDALLSLPVTEIDIATTLTPTRVIERATAAGCKVYPTGLAHGTVTVVADGQSFEVTTLRRDVETDGRHAVVAFTDDWHEDAKRRDFTINALACDLNGVVTDSVGGLADIAARRVRFIGEADNRIREDFLRILRFFRFTATYARGDADAKGLAACFALKDGLRQLSAERVGAEMMKFIMAPRAAEISALMQKGGILRIASGCEGHPDRLRRLQEIETALDEPADAITRLAALLADTPADAATIAQNFRLSGTQAEALVAASDINSAYQGGTTERLSRAQIYRVGVDAFNRALRVAWARSEVPATDPAWTDKSRLAGKWCAPIMPYSGGDLLALGIPPGPRVGRTLRAFEAWWIEADFPSDKAALDARLARLAEQS